MSGGAVKARWLRGIVGIIVGISYICAAGNHQSPHLSMILDNQTDENVAIDIHYTDDGAMYTQSLKLAAHKSTHLTLECIPDSIHSIEVESTRYNISSMISPQEQWHRTHHVKIKPSTGLGSFDIKIED